MPISSKRETLRVKSFIIVFIFSCLLLYLFVACSMNLDTSGIWKGEMSIIEKGKIERSKVELMVNQTGKKIAGKLTLWDPQGNQVGILDITSGVLDGNRISFIAEARSFGGTLQMRFDGTASAKIIKGSGILNLNDLTGMSSAKFSLKVAKQ